MVYQIPFFQFSGLAKYGLALSCTADSRFQLGRVRFSKVSASILTYTCQELAIVHLIFILGPLMSHIVNSASEGMTVILSRANVIQAVNMKERMAKEFSELVTK